MFETWLRISESLLTINNKFKGLQNKGVHLTEGSTEHHVDEVSDNLGGTGVSCDWDVNHGHIRLTLEELCNQFQSHAGEPRSLLSPAAPDEVR